MTKENSGRFASSFVGLLLLRADFNVQESVALGRHKIIDLIASKYGEDGSEIRFGVECKWIYSDSVLKIEQYKQQVSEMAAQGLKVELAVVVNEGEKLWISPGLAPHIIYDRSKTQVEIIPF